ncbi:MAG: hypothetical protein HRF45_10630 [Fimbriimonadia bacterium]|jgi:hypothetical protein
MDTARNGQHRQRPTVPFSAASAGVRDDACLAPQNIGNASVIGRDFDLREELRKRRLAAAKKAASG